MAFTSSPVQSSAIASIGYDPDARVLVVVFRNGRNYRYEGVTEKDHADFMAASSKGTHFNTVIRSRYEGKQEAN